MRTLEKRIAYARKNVEIQRESYRLAKAKGKAFLAGPDVDQALSILRQTEATIPELEISLRQTTDQLCILLGIPPEELRARLGPGEIPTAPPEVVVGIPADLLRRRPDVREAERRAAAQSAQIGVADSDFYPHISISGTLQYQAEHFVKLFDQRALSGNLTPGLTWNLLNYGRILNNVRLQDARFQELVATYQQTVLTADREAEDGLVTFLKAQERTRLQKETVDAGTSALKATQDLYEAGFIDYTRVAQLLLNQVVLEDTLAQAQGEIGLGLIQAYRALGGGWQIRCTGCTETPLLPQSASDSEPAPMTRVPASPPNAAPLKPVPASPPTPAPMPQAATPSRPTMLPQSVLHPPENDQAGQTEVIVVDFSPRAGSQK
jgi:outer membrane protein TolC